MLIINPESWNADGNDALIEEINQLFDTDIITVRIWEADVNTIQSSEDIELEKGLKVNFVDQDEHKKYRTGDYWLIPTRSQEKFEWPDEGKESDGIVYHYCPLAIVNHERDTWTVVQDCREVFPALTEMARETAVTETGRKLSIGVHSYNDARRAEETEQHKDDQLDIQGGKELTLNVGYWRDELDESSWPPPEPKLEKIAIPPRKIRFCVSEEEVMSLEKDKLTIGVEGSESQPELVVKGNLKVYGDVMSYAQQDESGKIYLGDKDEDQIIIEGELKSDHTSGRLKVTSPLEVQLEESQQPDFLSLFAANDSQEVKGGIVWKRGSASKELAAIYSKLDAESQKGDLRFSTASNSSPVERMVITADGNVGIGTENPEENKLKVEGGPTLLKEDLTVGDGSNPANVEIAKGNATLTEGDLTVTSGKVVITGEAEGDNKLTVRGTTYLGGNLTVAFSDQAINNIKSDTPLHVYKYQASNQDIIEIARFERVCDDAQDSPEAEGGYIGLYLNDTERRGDLNPSRIEGARISWRFDNKDNSERDGRLGFWTAIRNDGHGNNDSEIIERMTITKEGYVGIGTTDPQGKLQVSGTTYLGDALTVERGGVALTEDNLTVNSGNVAIGSENPGTHRLKVEEGTTHLGGKLTVEKGGVALTEDNLTVNSGNVAIGSENPGTHRLKVEEGTTHLGGKLTVNPSGQNEKPPALVVTKEKIQGTDQSGVYIVGQDDGITDIIFPKTAKSKIKWESKDDPTDFAYIFFKENSRYTKSRTADIGSQVNGLMDGFDEQKDHVRLSIGVGNDVMMKSEIQDALDIQGGACLTLNVGKWDQEISKEIGSFFDQTGEEPIGISFRVNDDQKMFIDHNGAVGIGKVPDSNDEVKLDVNGKVRANDQILTSDVTLKQNIQTLKDGLSKILGLRGVSFQWKDDQKAAQEAQIGLVAQEVEEIFPELVSTDSQGMKSLSYTKLIAPLIEAMKEQQQQISELINQVQQQQTQIEQLQTSKNK